jgi:hypothetical protein
MRTSLVDECVRQKVKPDFLPGWFGFEGRPSLPSNHVKTTQNLSGPALLFPPKKGGLCPSFFAV